MATTSKEQRKADQTKGRMLSVMDDALLAQFRLGYKFGYEDAKKGRPNRIAPNLEPLKEPAEGDGR